MIRDTISKIESRLQGASAINDEARAELLQLVGELRREITNLDEEDARRVAGLAHDTTHQVAGQTRNPELLKRSIDELSASVDGFEKSHPGLVQVVNRICTTLSNIGI